METIRKYNLSQAARMLNIKEMGRTKIYKLLRELGILDEINRPAQHYIDEGYLDFRTTGIRTQGITVQAPVVLVVGDKGLNFLKKTVEEYLQNNPHPVIYRRPSKIMKIDGDTITFRDAFE